MKKLNLIGAFAAAVLLLVGCEMSKEQVASIPGETTITATRDGAMTRSSIKKTGEDEDATYEILWSVPDKILVGYPGVTPATFTSTNKAKAASASFKGKLPDGEGPLVGIYPATKGNTCDEYEVFTVNFKDEQTAVDGTYDPDAFPAVAIGEGSNLSFLNVCGLLEVCVGYSDVTKITLINGMITDPPVIIEPDEPNGPTTRAVMLNVIPSGDLSVVIEDGVPVIDDFSEGTPAIYLNAPKGGVFKKDQLYYISVPPCEFPDGAVFILERQSGKNVQINLDWPLEVSRSSVHQVMTLFDENIPDDNIPDDPTPDDPTPDDPTPDDPAEGITIDGDMSDWAEIEGTVNKTGNIMEVKGFADDDHIYVYVKRAKSGRWAQLWNENASAGGYYYYDFDLDNNPETGDHAEGDRGNFECWAYLYPFGPAVGEFIEEPTGGTKGMSLSGVKSAGSFTGDKDQDDAGVVELEVAFPRANLPAITANTITVTVWGNKDGSPVTKATIKLGEGGDEPTPDDPTPDDPQEIVMDGDMSDWDAVDGVKAGSFEVFKYASDEDNLFFYFKIKRSKIIAAKSEPFVFNWRRYIAFGIDTDNNSETGSAVTFAGMNIPGCEACGNFYPFRGIASEASGTDGVEIVNGTETQGGVSTEISSSVPDGAADKVTVYGQVDDDFVYVEAGIARSAIGSPASGTAKIQLSLAWDLTEIMEITLN